MITGQYVDCDYIGEDVAIVVVGDNKIWKTDDLSNASPTWSNTLDVEGDEYFTKLLRIRTTPASDSRAYVLAEQKEDGNRKAVVYRSDDSGDNWTKYDVVMVSGTWGDFEYAGTIGDFYWCGPCDCELDTEDDDWCCNWTYSVDNNVGTHSWAACEGVPFKQCRTAILLRPQFDFGWGDGAVPYVMATMGQWGWQEHDAESYYMTGSAALPPWIWSGLGADLHSRANFMIHHEDGWFVVSGTADCRYGPGWDDSLTGTIAVGYKGVGYTAVINHTNCENLHPFTGNCPAQMFGGNWWIKSLGDNEFDYAMSAKGFDVGTHNADVVYVGTEDRILKSTDGAQTWEDYIEDEGAVDIECMRSDNSDSEIMFWSMDGKLYQTTNGAKGFPILTEMKYDNNPLRVSSDPNDGWPVYVFYSKGYQLYDLMRSYDGVNWDTLVADIAWGRSLRYYLDDSTAKLYYVDGETIWFSNDEGESWESKIGDWGSLSAARRIDVIV